MRLEDSRATTWQNQQSECAPSEDSDQPGRIAPIKVFVGFVMRRLKKE